MAHSQGAYFRKPQGYRRLAPAPVAAFAISFFLAGIAATGGGLSVIFVLSFSLFAGAALFVWKRSSVTVVLIPLACLAGIFYYHLYFTWRDSRLYIPLDVSVSFSGVVSAEPGHSAKSEYFPLRLAPPFRGEIRIVVSPDSGFRYGDELQLKGLVRAPENERDLPVSIFPKIELVDRGRGSPVRQVLSNFKYELLQIFPRYLPTEEAAFLGGITLGAKSSLSPQFAEALAKSGTTHLVALSGYNIAILVFVVFGVCLRLFGRRPAFYLTTVAILGFAVMVGAEPSVVRASAMAFVLLLARELGRPYGLPYALLWTAFFMVLFDPSALFMPGFQLSFMSLLGIVYLSPLISKRLGENVALTISAQLAVAPIALYNFGNMSLTSFMANALILPFMPITMFFGFVLLLCGSIFAPLGILTGLAAHILLAYEVAMIRFFGVFSLPFGAGLLDSGSGFGGFGIILYYLFLITLVRRHELRVREKEGRA
jgi:competence protein ComEC